MKVEIIASFNFTTVDGRDMLIVTTVNNNVIWVPKHKFDTNAETITFKPMKAGDEYTTKDGSTAKLLKDRNEFLGYGKQIIKKFDTKEILDHLVNKGVTPTFALN